jgi:hypothetical protein
MLAVTVKSAKKPTRRASTPLVIEMLFAVGGAGGLGVTGVVPPPPHPHAVRRTDVIKPANVVERITHQPGNEFIPRLD